MTPLRKIKIWRWSLTSRCVMARTTPIQSVDLIKPLETKTRRFQLTRREAKWFDIQNQVHSSEDRKECL
jgi:hypothetical protein